MLRLSTVVIIVTLIFGVWCNDDPDCKNPDKCDTDRDLLQIEAEQLVTVIENVLQLSGECGVPVEDDQIEYWLYTRTNPDTPTILNASNPDLDSTKQLVLIIPGWVSAPTTPVFIDLKDAYLERYDCNVIILNWFAITVQLLNVSVCQMPDVAQKVADLLCLLHELGANLANVHALGHSLGGQLSGLIGQETQAICNIKIGRITAMDPAGLVFQEYPKNKRLDKSDARFVQVIHTDEGLAGYYGNFGGVDFHVNCGSDQPGCAALTPTSLVLAAMTLARARESAACNNGTDLSQALQDFINAVACSHFFSVYVTVETVNSNNFIAKSCNSCPCQCKADKKGATFTIMGENCPTTSRGSYWIPTSSAPPFAIGCPPHKVIC